MQQVEAGLNLTVVLTSDGQCFQMGETGASGRVKWDGCKEPELVCHACLPASLPGLLILYIPPAQTPQPAYGKIEVGLLCCLSRRNSLCRG